MKVRSVENEKLDLIASTANSKKSKRVLSFSPTSADSLHIMLSYHFLPISLSVLRILHRTLTITHTFELISAVALVASASSTHPPAEWHSLTETQTRIHTVLATQLSNEHSCNRRLTLSLFLSHSRSLPLTPTHTTLTDSVQVSPAPSALLLSPSPASLCRRSR
eukprot:765714-Hanusia_phi.AAC.1